MSLKYYRDLMQGTDAWLEARRGILTASEMKLALTPTLKIADNEKTRAHVYELAAQRVTGHVEPSFQGFDMVRGQEEEQDALSLYSEQCAPVEYCGFITNDKWGFTLGYSPDGLVGEPGLAECKSRNQKLQMQTIVEYLPNDTIPEDFRLQCQTGLLVSEREWLDFISYSNGMPMVVVRVYPDAEMQQAIVDAASAFEEKIAAARLTYDRMADEWPRFFPTERKARGDMMI